MRLRFRDKPTSLDGVTENKRLVATFPGDRYVAEREGGELHIYVIGDENDLASLGTTTMDRSVSEPKRLRALNDLHRRFYRGDAA